MPRVKMTLSDPRRRACENDVLRRGAEKAVIVTLRRYGIVDDGCLTSGIERWELGAGPVNKAKFATP
jgi:hypothetical protein